MWHEDNLQDTLQGKRIVFYRSKTQRKQDQEPHSVAVAGRIKEILDSYTDTSGYLLPIVVSDNPKTRRHQIIRALRKVNKEIKEIAAGAGIPNPNQITFYVARHTFATMCLIEDIPIYTVSKLLGHTDVKHTQIYAKIIDKKKDEAIDKLPSY